jgi:hypothetical protein
MTCCSSDNFLIYFTIVIGTADKNECDLANSHEKKMLMLLLSPEELFPMMAII